MKIARVFYQEYNGRPVGTIFDVFIPANHPGALLSSYLKEVEVDDDFDVEVMKANVSPEGEITFEEDADKVAAKEMRLKQEQVSVKYEEMNTEVYAEMAECFNTSKSDSATAFYETWKLMVSKPQLFINENMIVDKAAAGLEVGDLLNTVERISSYAQARIEIAEEYSVWRVRRIKQFQQERQAILQGQGI